MEYFKLYCFLVVSCVSLSQAFYYAKNDLQLDGDINQAKHSYRPSKRNLIQFDLMIRCATGRSSFDYNGYGCWCGHGGSGQPVDGTDRCCQAHDRCYDNVVASNVCTFGIQVYAETYTREGCYGCSSSNNRCEQAICLCDRLAVQCFRRKRYQRRYADYDKEQFCN